MADKIIALLSIAAFIGFVGVVVVFVNEPDLWVVALVVSAMGLYDFVSATFGKAKKRS